MKKLSLLVFILFFAVTAYSAYLKNVPVDLKQLNGAVIHCFVTGDYGRILACPFCVQKCI